MSETAWMPLPTHDGWWWIRYFGYTDAINVTMEDDGPHRDDDNALLCESDEIRYFPIPDPPADGEKLPEGTWQAYVASLSQEDRDKMLNVILGHLLGEGMESDFCYRPFCDYGDGDIDEEAVFWRSSGENVLDS